MPDIAWGGENHRRKNAQLNIGSNNVSFVYNIEVRKSKLFILAGVGGHDRQVYVQVESHTQV